MTKRTVAILSTIALTVALAAFAGSALAGNGQGKADPQGNAYGLSQSTPAADHASPPASPGNSANAPGQTGTAGTASTPAATNKSVASPTSSGVKPGVKPSNTTTATKWTSASATSS